jgi:hypothetical protein
VDVIRPVSSKLLLMRYRVLGQDLYTIALSINEDLYSRDPQIIFVIFVIFSAFVTTDIFLGLDLGLNITAVQCNNSCLRESAIRHLHSITRPFVFLCWSISRYVR